MAPPDEAEFEAQLSAYQANVVVVTRCFFAMTAINRFASQDSTLLERLNHAPEFWNLVQATNQTTLFITLGRILDQTDARFSLDKLVKGAQSNSGAIFAESRLADRKRRGSANADEWLCDYLKNIYVPLPKDFRALRRACDHYRRRFEAIYRPIRNQVYAHSIAARAEAAELFAATNLIEMQRIIRFLDRVGSSLWLVYWNGENPLHRRRFPPVSVERLANTPPRSGGSSDQEIIFHAVRKVMEQLGKR
ncbi:hypothetical protein EJV46_13445 [Roseococcus sp. SYP-B2431]|uniref:AbiU2 domain-containing protein n=1 Tax=Roseococcus sp. SYP-B2431 TaxID=2496640 RepID=UPI00103AB3EC|nr:hypothetical protein [Roseococcus sp. SYP-B2431]TCH98190.1 hypothetical protein EJV46_13445 [Roseococcus sp. SYP-B2431]